eukprot:g13077.t1 g13077   contig7:828618-829676(+)
MMSGNNTLNCKLKKLKKLKADGDGLYERMHQSSFIESLSSIHKSASTTSLQLTKPKHSSNNVSQRRTSAPDDLASRKHVHPPRINSQPRRRSSAVSFSLNDAAVLNVNYDETNGAVDFSSSKDQEFEASMRTSALKSPEATMKYHYFPKPKTNTKRGVGFQGKRNDVVQEAIANATAETATLQNRGYRSDYKLGQPAQSLYHMIADYNRETSVELASSLKKHDFAFVKRSDTTWTYAIVASRSFVQDKVDSGESPNEEEECMTFVMNDIGAIKVIRKRHWGELIRQSRPLSSRSADDSMTLKQDESNTHGLVNAICRECEEIEEGIPRNVSFILSKSDDDFSLISSVSNMKF